jgi:flavin-dependent dehydrogenase
VIDPLTAKGSIYGLKSSYLAADVINDFILGKAVTEGYDEA